MQTLTTNQEIQETLDYQSLEFLIEILQKDSFKFYNKIDGKENTWIGRVILMKGLEHHGSTTPFGFLLHYQFQKNSDYFDAAIREIRVPESIDEFLDLFNEVNRNGMFFNLEYYSK